MHRPNSILFAVTEIKIMYRSLDIELNLYRYMGDLKFYTQFSYCLHSIHFGTRQLITYIPGMKIIYQQILNDVFEISYETHIKLLIYHLTFSKTDH